MKPLEQAQAEVMSALRPLPVEPCPLDEALGLVLAAPVVAPHAVPPFANSAVDGFAVVGVDRPGRLAVIEDVPAGSVPQRRVESGLAIRIMTGAPIPEGADRVIRVEDTSAEGDQVDIRVVAPEGAGIRPAGGDIVEGEVVFEAGTRLGAAHLGVLASIGMVSPPVFRRPRVAMFSTGDEVCPPSTGRLAPGKIRDSNRPLLRALLTEVGAEVIDLGIVGDRAEELRSILAEAAAAADAIVTSGGVSMGDYDLVKQVLGELGGVELWKVAMQPAKPFAFGAIGGTPLFGLPGNPVSVFVAFEQFVRPGLLKMMGSAAMYRPRIRGVAGMALETDPEKTVFIRARAEYVDGEWLATPSGGQSSNVLSAVAAGNCFVVVERGRGPVAPGEAVPLEMFQWPAVVSDEKER